VQARSIKPKTKTKPTKKGTAMRKIEWKKHEPTEKSLKEFGLTWDIEEIPFSQIDEDLSANNHARRIRIDDSTVADYLTAMEQGDDFPLGVAVKQPGSGKYLVLGGNHTRLAARQFGLKSMGFYVVDTKDPMVMDLLPKVLNRRHGLRKSREEAITDAINAVAIHKLTVNQAAERFGVHPHTLHVNNRVTLAVRRFKKLGVKAESVPRTAILRLNTIPIDSVLEKAVVTAEKQRMNGTEVAALVDAIHENSSSEKDQLAVIADFNSKLVEGKPVLSKGTESEKLWARYTRLLVTLEVLTRNKKTLSQLGCPTESARTKIALLQRSLSNKLNALSSEA
jgi:hypothetical protein